MEITVVLFLLLILAFQLWVSYRVMRSDVYEREQKSAQLTFIWLLPALGAIIAFFVLKDADPTPRQAERTEERARRG